MGTLPKTQDPAEIDPLDREYAAGWRPQSGEKVRGKLVDLSSRERDEAFGGGRYPILTLELAESARTKDGSVDDFVAVHALHEVLERELARIRPKLGDELGVLYQGKHPERGYHRYRVHRYGNDGAGFDWGAFGGEAGTAPDGADAAVAELQRPLAAVDGGEKQDDGGDVPY